MQIVVEQFFSKPIELHFKGKQNLGRIFLQVMSVNACACAQRRAGERQVPPTRGACVRA